ncbi:phosphate ABC transporter substrate-binding protein [bacterium]|nr:phosphate ABC transporter substrate-binding protein [bacterium]
MKKIPFWGFLTAMIMFLETSFVPVTISAQNKIIIEGYSTALLIAEGCAESFRNRYPDLTVNIKGGGSGIGIGSMINGGCQIAISSRPIKDEELCEAISKGVDLKGNIVAMEGVGMIVHPSNAVKDLSAQQIKDIYSGKISYWNEVGGDAGKIVIISREDTSDIFHAFTQWIMAGENTRTDALVQRTSPSVITTVSRNIGAIGYAELGYITDHVKVVSIDGVEASKMNILSSKYLFSRPIYMYTNGGHEGIIKSFIDFVLSHNGQTIVEKAGFVSLK